MWRSPRDEELTCIACGATVGRADAREYDRFGNRWDREDKAFEPLCKPGPDALSHQPRGDLEELLVDADAGETDRGTFLASYVALVEERYGSLEERER